MDKAVEVKAGMLVETDREGDTGLGLADFLESGSSEETTETKTEEGEASPEETPSDELCKGSHTVP